jgi:hypothetical protein
MNDVKRPSLRETARRGADANRQAKPAAPPPKPTPPPVKPAEAGAAVEEVTITAACGHTITAAPLGKPAFMAERLKKLAANPCPDCKRKAQQEREAAEQEAARLRREEKAAREPRREKPRPRLARLPHGSTFHVVYDAEAVKWSGTLTVPAGGIYNASVTTAEDSAVFGLLMQLDRAYRHIPAEEAAAPETLAK